MSKNYNPNVEAHKHALDLIQHQQAARPRCGTCRHYLAQPPQPDTGMQFGLCLEGPPHATTTIQTNRITGEQTTSVRSSYPQVPINFLGCHRHSPRLEVSDAGDESAPASGDGPPA